MAYKTCDWCGRSYKPLFSADRDMGNTFMDQMGLRLVTKAVGGAARLAGKRNFCSKQCKLAYENSKNGENSSNATISEEERAVQNSRGGSSGGIGNMFSGVFSSVGDEMMSVLNDKKENKAKTEEIVNLQFGTDKEELQNQIQNLFTQISSLPRFKTPEQKALYNAIKEKLEFGIMKLSSSGASAEADYFQKKFEKLK